MRERVLRLGIPFAVAAGILMPLAYYPSYLVAGADPGFLAYARDWLSLGFWPNGPAWFIWLLFVFDAVVAGLYVLSRHWIANTLARQYLGLSDHPRAFVCTLIAVSALAYVPMELAFGADRWLTFGPVSLQASRLLLYATYFIAGVHLGASGTESGLFAQNTGLARRWPIWLLAGLAAYALRLAVIIMFVLPAIRADQPLPLTLSILDNLTLVLCCGTISFAFIALFRRFAIARLPVFDSLSVNSYGMYLVHYPVVVWLQFALLAVALGPIAKGAIVYFGAVMLSWAVVVVLRRIPVIARVL